MIYGDEIDLNYFFHFHTSSTKERFSLTQGSHPDLRSGSDLERRCPPNFVEFLHGRGAVLHHIVV